VFQGGDGGHLEWECGNILGAGGEFFQDVVDMRWEIDLISGFGMICGVGTNP
jgi:hypothetical protein